MTATEKKQAKARQMRYKRPIVKDLNLDAIQSELWEIQSECEDIRWMYNNEDILVDAMDGDEEEAYEFRMMFSDLAAECERMQEDLAEQWVPDCFDLLFVAAGAENDYGGLLGWDSFKQDYFGLEVYESEWAENEAGKHLERMTKKELIEAMRQCFRVYQSYIALRYRYDCLEASLAILRDKNNGYLQVIKAINEEYELAERQTDGFRYGWSDTSNLDKLIQSMPQEAWIW